MLLLAIPAMLAAPLGVWLAHSIPAAALLLSFAVFNVIAAGLMQLRLRSEDRVDVEPATAVPICLPPTRVRRSRLASAAARWLASSASAGLIMVPFQTLLLDPVRLASRISLAVVLFASMAAVAAHLGRARTSTGGRDSSSPSADWPVRRSVPAGCTV